MCENVHSNPPDGIERTQQVERLTGAKPEDGLVSRHDHESLHAQHVTRSPKRSSRKHMKQSKTSKKSR